MKLDRRSFIFAGAAAAGATALARDPLTAASRAAVPRAGEVAFPQGVASGQATCRGITLWTLAEGLEQSSRLRLELSRDPDFRSVLLRRDVLVEERRNFTVHARLDRRPLEPGEQYFYRFFSSDSESPIGRFRTSLPGDSCQPVRIGFFSCQRYPSGFYTAHDGLADEDLDMVVCLGDYLYEGENDGEGIPGRGHVPDREIARLADYRTRYAQYHSDPSLIRMRQSHPMMAIWDDHEVDNNYSRNRPGDDMEVGGIPFRRREQNAYRAFFEHMPRVRNSAERDRIYGSLSLGRNAELFLLDERQYRDDQPCGDQIGTANCPEAFEEGRTMLGRRQKRWFTQALEASRATWKVVANQVMIMALDFPAQNPINPDQWDGYKAERAELMRFISARGVDDVTFVTGDIHTFFAGQVTPSGRQPSTERAAATEFVGGSISSEGIADGAGTTPEERELLADLSDSQVRVNNPHIRYSNQEVKGYGVLEAREDELRVTFRAARSVRMPESDVYTLQRFRVESGNPEVEVLEGGFPN
jgi:alkaline phosphatase D